MFKFKFMYYVHCVSFVCNLFVLKSMEGYERFLVHACLEFRLDLRYFVQEFYHIALTA